MKICQHSLIMSVFNRKTQNLRSMPQETQQKTFKFVMSFKGEIRFRAPPGRIWNNGLTVRGHFLSLVVLILNTYGGY